MRHLRELPAWLEAELGAEGKLYLLHGKNSDSGNFALPASFPGDAAFAGRTDQAALFQAAAEARVTKSPAEVEVLRYVNWVRSARDLPEIEAWVWVEGKASARLPLPTTPSSGPGPLLSSSPSSSPNPSPSSSPNPSPSPAP